MAGNSLDLIVVDDEEVIRTYLFRMLTNLGHRVVCVASGREAIDKVNQRKFDAIFTDMVMPEIDGLALFRSLKKTQPTLPVIVMTGFAGDEKIEEAMQLGAIGCLYKPFEIPLLKEMLERLQK